MCSGVSCSTLRDLTAVYVQSHMTHISVHSSMRWPKTQLLIESRLPYREKEQCFDEEMHFETAYVQRIFPPTPLWARLPYRQPAHPCSIAGLGQYRQWQVSVAQQCPTHLNAIQEEPLLGQTPLFGLSRLLDQPLQGFTSLVYWWKPQCIKRWGLNVRLLQTAAMGF